MKFEDILDQFDRGELPLVNTANFKTKITNALLSFVNKSDLKKIINARSLGLVIKGEDLEPRDCGFDSQQRKLDEL